MEQMVLLKWVEAISLITFGEIVAIDGKTLCHSYDKSKDKSAIHMVSGWATNNGLVLGQKKVDKKSNEITVKYFQLSLFDQDSGLLKTTSSSVKPKAC